MVLDASLLRFKMYPCWRSPDCSIDDLMILYLEKKDKCQEFLYLFQVLNITVPGV